MFVFLYFALLLAADPAASAPVTDSQPAQAVETKKKERKICRKPEAATGSNMVRRVCKTESEWAKRDEGASADDLKTMGSN